MRTRSQQRIPPPPLDAAKTDAPRLDADRLARVPPLARPAPSSVIPLWRHFGPGGPLMVEAGGPPSGRAGSATPRWGAFVSVLMHALILALLLITVALEPPPVETPPAAISVVLANGGELEHAAPKAERHGPPQHARAPKAEPPPKPRPQPKAKAPARNPPDVHLNLAQQEPLQPFSFKAPAPVPRAPSRPRPRYLVMNNAEFYGGAPAAPETQSRRRGMNLQLSQSALAKLQAPEFKIKGKVGADWKAAFTEWVNERKYYPRDAIEMGQQGSSTIHLVIHPDGSVTGLRLLRSSGSAFLDQAWLDLFRDTKVPPFPPGTKAKQVEIVATMHYRLIR